MCKTVWIQIRPDFGGPDLDPNCLQRSSADDTSKQRVNLSIIFERSERNKRTINGLTLSPRNRVMRKKQQVNLSVSL